MTDAAGGAAVERRRRIAAGAVVVALTATALLFRTAGVHDAVVRDDGVFLQGADAWHHLRQVEQLVRHFPTRMRFDPYALHPAGQEVGVAPLFDVLAAVVALLAGALTPSPRTVTLVTAWMPAALGALTCVPAYLIASRAAGRAAGLLAALCVAFLPGQLLSRTMLGFADHHALEALLAPLTVLALMRALAAEERGRALRRAAVAGIALLAYLLSWSGGAMLVLVLGAWAALQINVEHARGEGGGRTATVAAVAFGTALVGQAAFGWDLAYADLQRLALVGSLAASVLLGALGHRLARGGRSRVHLPMATLVAAAAAALVIARVSPGTLRGGWHALTWFAGSGLQETVGEAAPLLRPRGSFSLVVAWAHYGTVLPGALLGLAVLVRRVVREGRAGDSLVAVWSLAMLAATLGQNRFGYYLAVCAGVLCGVLLGPPLARLWEGRTGTVPVWIRRGLWPTAAVFGLVVPVAPVAVATSLSYEGPRTSVVEALRFLRDETPQPFRDAAYFEQLVAREDARAPRTGVLAWWDLGYWITTLARRVPASNPTQAGAVEVAEILLTTSPERAAAECRRRGLTHVLLDGETPMLPTGPGRLAGELGQVARWAGVDTDELFRTYYVRSEDGTRQPLVLFEPAYFETLAVRLHVFEGERFVPFGSSQIVRWREAPDGEGDTRLEVVELERFETFDRAARHLRRALEEGETNVRLVSDDPLFSCVPLEPAAGFRRVHASREAAAVRLMQRIPDVQVYEVLGE